MQTILPAHGVGGAQDLPIPAGYAITGAGVAVAVSFIVLVLAWRRPRFDGTRTGIPLRPHLASTIDSTWLRIVARTLGMLILAYLVWALWGPDLASNPIFGIVYVLLWVGLVPASLALGPVWRALNPLRTLHAGITRTAGASARDGFIPLPAWVGYWPAALGLFAFVWLELVHPASTYLAPLQGWLALYVLFVLGGAVLFGPKWFARADPFEAYSTLIAHLSPIGRTREGTLVWQSPLNHLDGLNPTPSRVAIVAVLLGSTAYDSFSRSTTWAKLSQTIGINPTVSGTLVLLAFCVFVWATLTAGTMATTPPPNTPRRALPALFAHSVVPIIVGYIVAHYLTLLLEYGQMVLIQISDPMVNGSNLFGTAEWSVNYFLSGNPTTLAVIKVAAVVAGHVIGVISAHDRAVKILPKRHQVTGQLALLAVMVVYTVGGLYLLFSG
ncbi:hypothetical protein ACFVJS_05690 [Nocardioides sp. NPDC057772]|uniref:hypothetical protein n=1 Tax=Nocardioides sp. NPDC057772 TaxID=3346245 RepID=UPI0002028A13|nr:hypothetical protein NBCG_02902 [Nocardioidaceae bacterium Broad-1]